MHVEIPSTRDIHDLLEVTDQWTVSIYLASTPQTDDTEVERIGWKNAVSEAVNQLEARGASKSEVAKFVDTLDEITSDPTYWQYQANTLAVFTDGEVLHTYRLPSSLEQRVFVADRYNIKPLLRSITFPQAAHILALAMGSVKVLEIGADYGPVEVEIANLPTDVESHANKLALADRAPRGQAPASEASTLRATQYARAVARAIRAATKSDDLPLILAATAPLDSIYREVNTSSRLVPESITLSPERVADHELAAAARDVLDQVYARQIRELHDLYQERVGQERTSTDLANIARYATYGLIDTLFVDIDDVQFGTVDDGGAVQYISEADGGYGLADEIARRVIQNSGRVIAVRADEVPGGTAAAAILRYAPIANS